MGFIKQVKSTWLNPPAIFRPAPFWSWNGKLERKRLCRQIGLMHEAGMGGFFMHSRYGLKTVYLSEEWFECVSSCIEEAGRLGMKAYLYDEDRWPSATAGGTVTRKNKQYRMRYLAARRPDNIDNPASPEDRLGIFKVEPDPNGLMKSYEIVRQKHPAKSKDKTFAFDIIFPEPLPWLNNSNYLDTANPDAVAEFIRATHDAYAGRYQSHFGSTVPAIFTDEPVDCFWNFDQKAEKFRVKWTQNLPEEFKKRRGYDILEFLPELFFAGTEGEFSKVRYDFYKTMTELFVESYSKQIGHWCEKHSISLTGHIMSEDSLRGQIEAVSACMPHYQHMQWPGVDILKDQADELATVKQCTSVASQFGKERILSELYGCTGWDWPLEGHKFIADWQFALGVNFLCPHLSHYSLAGAAKRDYPASILNHSPWWKYYKVVEDYLGRISLMLTKGRPVRDVVVIHPVESGWGLFRKIEAGKHDAIEPLEKGINSIIYTLSGQHYDWDFADESILAEYGRIERLKFAVGKMQYSMVIVPPAITLRSTTVSLLQKFVGTGGKVLFVDSRPHRIDGCINEKTAELIELCHKCGFANEELVRKIESILPRRISITENGKEQTCVWAMLRELEGGKMLFVQSHDRKNNHQVSICLDSVKGPVVQWDAVTGEKRSVTFEASPEGVKFDIQLAPSGSALLTTGIDVSDVCRPLAEATVINRHEIKGPFEIELTEPNTIPLDYCQFRFGQDDFSELVPTLKADEIIRRRFGLNTRLGNEQQPWYLYATGAVDTKPRGQTQMRFGFHVTVLPSHCRLVIENPDDYKISVNNITVDAADSSWVDEDLKTIDISKQLQTGENTVQLDFNYRPDMELEDLYLLGDFGVGKIDKTKPLQPQNITMVSVPQIIETGPWTGQGLDFYSAAVLYKLSVKRPASGQRVQLCLPDISCTAAAIHVGDKTFVLAWQPFTADITEALVKDINSVTIEVIGGRKNILGPLHVATSSWTSPDKFDPNHKDRTFEYQLSAHGLTGPVILEIIEKQSRSA